MKNLGNLMKQAQQMQAKMAEMQEKLAAMEIGGAAGGGMVRRPSAARARSSASRSTSRSSIPTTSRCWRT